jgi:glucose/arabinose dehydrogenase
VEVVATGLEAPWALAFAPDGRIFLTERPGRLRVIQDGRLRPEPMAVLPVSSQGESGLMGLALDPSFSTTRFLYVCYTYSASGGLRNRVARLVERGGGIGQDRILLDNIPGAWIHDGGRVKFGPDGKLYVTTGDAAEPSIAQDLRSLAGKVLRVNPDGSIPPDNPFPGSPVWSLGHRNPQGLAWHPTTGALFATEHGTGVHDEVNVIHPGKNYGWPTVIGPAGDRRFAEPILTFTPNIAPSGAAFAGPRYPDWQGNLFFVTLRGRHLHRVVLASPDFTRVLSHERLFEGVFGRLREIMEAPDGSLYLLTNNRDGRGSPGPDDDRVLRIVPAR